MDDLKCSGAETSVDYCVFLGWGQHNCQHIEDAGVRCVGSKSVFCVCAHICLKS